MMAVRDRGSYYEQNKERILEQRRVYREKNKERIAEYARAYHKRNAEKIRQRVKEYRAANGDRIRERMRLWQRDNPDKRRSYKLRLAYGLSMEEYEAKCREQGGLCAICGKTPKNFAVDHCHATGKVRGLLCRKCNLILGMVEESADTLRNAAAYLESFNGNRLD